MSTTESNAHSAPKKGGFRVILALIIAVVALVFLYDIFMSTRVKPIGQDSASQEELALRIMPVAGFALVDVSGPKVLKTGQQVYESVCAACHGAGVAGAPIFKDATAWAPVIAKGYETLVQHALNGINAMPARGGNPSLTDLEVERAIVYMVNNSGGSFAEPKDPEADGSTEAAPAAATDTAAPAAAPVATAAPAAETTTVEVAAVETVDPAGENLYKQVCFACHAAGVAGAHKFGDKAAWATPIATGLDTMVANVINGKGVMPARGGSTATDEQIRAAVIYMTNAAK